MRILELKGSAWGDRRGWGVDPVQAVGLDPDTMRNLHVVSVEPGSVRGNHRHPDTTEWMLVFGGRACVAWQSPGEDRDSREMLGHLPVLLEFPPGVAHAVEATGDSPVYLVCYADGDPEQEPVEPLL